MLLDASPYAQCVAASVTCQGYTLPTYSYAAFNTIAAKRMKLTSIVINRNPNNTASLTLPTTATAYIDGSAPAPPGFAAGWYVDISGISGALDKPVLVTSVASDSTYFTYTVQGVLSDTTYTPSSSAPLYGYTGGLVKQAHYQAQNVTKDAQFSLQQFNPAEADSDISGVSYNGNQGATQVLRSMFAIVNSVDNGIVSQLPSTAQPRGTFFDGIWQNTGTSIPMAMGERIQGPFYSDIMINQPPSYKASPGAVLDVGCNTYFTFSPHAPCQTLGPTGSGPFFMWRMNPPKPSGTQMYTALGTFGIEVDLPNNMLHEVLNSSDLVDTYATAPSGGLAPVNPTLRVSGNGSTSVIGIAAAATTSASFATWGVGDGSPPSSTCTASSYGSMFSDTASTGGTLYVCEPATTGPTWTPVGSGSGGSGANTSLSNLTDPPFSGHGGLVYSSSPGVLMEDTKCTLDGSGDLGCQITDGTLGIIFLSQTLGTTDDSGNINLTSQSIGTAASSTNSSGDIDVLSQATGTSSSSTNSSGAISLTTQTSGPGANYSGPISILTATSGASNESDAISIADRASDGGTGGGIFLSTSGQGSGSSSGGISITSSGSSGGTGGPVTISSSGGFGVSGGTGGPITIQSGVGRLFSGPSGPIRISSGLRGGGVSIADEAYGWSINTGSDGGATFAGEVTAYDGFTDGTAIGGGDGNGSMYNLTSLCVDTTASCSSTPTPNTTSLDSGTITTDGSGNLAAVSVTTTGSLSVGGRLSNYNGNITTGLGQPVIVASGSLTESGGGPGAFPCQGVTYCPAGIYRLQGYVVIKTGATGVDVNYSVQYWDGTASSMQTLSVGPLDASSAGNKLVLDGLVFHTDGAHTINVITTTSGTGTAMWTEYWVMERIQ